MVTKKTLPDIIIKLMSHLDSADGIYRDSLIEKIINICNQQNYLYINNFDWYISRLIDLTYYPTSTHGALIASQLMDTAIRVKVIRPFAVTNMVKLIVDDRFFNDIGPNSSMLEVLYAAAWLVGEFAECVEDPVDVVNGLLRQEVTSLPAHIQSVYMQNALKIFAYITSKENPSGQSKSSGVNLIGGDANSQTPATNSENVVDELLDALLGQLETFTKSTQLEVQERACYVLQVVKLYQEEIKKGTNNISSELHLLFAEEFKPVAPGTQKRVPVPEGLDLDSWINKPPPPVENDKYTNNDWAGLFPEDEKKRFYSHCINSS